MPPETRCHPERSEAASKDPAKLLSSSATGFLDFARNDYLPLWERRVPLCRHYECGANHNQEERKELAARECSDQFRVGLTKVFNHDSKDRVTNEKPSGQNAVGLARARPHKPQDCEQHDSLEESFIKLRRMSGRQN
jgi:hypothetical protein